MRAINNTCLIPCVSGVLSFIFKKYITRSNLDTHYVIGDLMNGILAGLVVTAGPCNQMDTWVCLPVGASAFLVYSLSTRILLKLKIDDALEAF